ncbi:ribosome maturation factor RimM [Aquabacterium sp.]|uniref:ribosome maturation factor RimM n=1 Tax=Aquabacterium TaxID=92793 RepID=UPI001D344A49|nr:ribosome maturation factor RimM [Aquabacterium sp.]MBT9610103.1 16S rRNA processing protein RimM [Aquabacterium sp.]|tara:strand:- start:170 stop:847 length:678 start_codon:yes stop_codon:yes gene_type:complete
MSDRATPSPLLLDDGVAWPEDAVEVGRVVDAWGVKGGIKVMPFSSDPQALFCTKKWFLRPAEVAVGAVVRPGAGAGAGTGAKPVSAVASAAQAARLNAPRFLQVKSAREQSDIVVATCEGLDDRNAAEALKGARVFVSRSAFPTPDDGEFYWIDLIGLDVSNPQGEALGRVVDLIDTGPNSVLRLEGEAGADGKPVERLIPFVSAYILSVSLADKRIVADWGLDY